MIKAYISRLKRYDYRHFICIAITLGFFACAFQFPNALPRLGEAIRDLVNSLAYYVFEMVNPGSSPLQPSVNSAPSWKWAPDPFPPLSLFPSTWEEFVVAWDKYWATFITEDNFVGYITAVGDFLFYSSRFIILILPLVLILAFKLKGYTSGEPSKRKKRSRPLRAFEWVLFHVVYPVISWTKDFIAFVKANENYWKLWLCLWLLYFNAFSIIVAAFAWYFFFIIDFELLSLYTQVTKLLTDLTPVIRFIPALIWSTVGIVIYNHICTSMAFARLYHYEHCNRAFLEERGVVTTVYGPMGAGKTQLLTSMALSAEIKQFDDAFDIMLETDLKYPNFPWQTLRDVIRERIDKREMVDLSQAKKWVNKCRRNFEYVSEHYSPRAWQESRKKWRKRGKFKFDYTFGYDYEHYSYTYNDEMKISHLYDAILDYTQAYMIFTVQTTVLFSNYSIRVDSILNDVGNMPLRDNDFFKRDPRYQEAYSRHAHIIDFDMLRLGKKMIKNNEKARRLSFGVYVVTEIDKERKNTLELQEDKKKTDEVNQKNDLFNACLMMCRHAAVVANRVFIRIICDLQRPEAWGAGGRELGEVIYIKGKGDMSPTLPFFSPYWLCQGLFGWLKRKRNDFHSAYEYIRRDGTLLKYLVDNVTHHINHHYDKVEGKFNKQTLNLELQSGRLDGDVKKAKWRILTKKDRARRYKTDCLETVFESYLPNTMYIDDFVMYANEVGTLEENGLQDSFFQNDIISYKKAA